MSLREEIERAVANCLGDPAGHSAEQVAELVDWQEKVVESHRRSMSFAKADLDKLNKLLKSKKKEAKV